MPRVWVFCLLFLSSYLPLFALLGVRSIDTADHIATVCGVLVIAGAAGTAIFLAQARSKPTGSYELLEVERRDGDVAAYAATYLLPFVTVFTDDWRDVATLSAFILFLGIIYVRSRLIYVNPLLALFGYHLWRVLPRTVGADKGSAPWPKYLLSDSQAMVRGKTIKAYRVMPDLLLLDEEID